MTHRISTLPHVGPIPEARPLGPAVAGRVHVTTLPSISRPVEQIDRFVGIPYCPRHMDCADLAMLVQRELFSKAVHLPGRRPRPMDAEAQAREIASMSAQLAYPVERPNDGDAVLMREAGTTRAGHIGTYFFINFTPYVLHTSHALGGSLLHRLQDLKGYGLTVEGYYRWK